MTAKGRDMNAPFARPMLNSPAREGTADAELFIKRVIARLDASHETNYMVEKLMNLDRNFWLRERNESAVRHSS
jgi:hypothetical protein